jgi:hypothetical protein
MEKLPSHRSDRSLLSQSVFSALIILVFGYSKPSFAQQSTRDQALEVHNLPSLMARSPHSSDVLLTSLDTVFHDREVCCGKDSALEDVVQTVDPKSLADVAGKLAGRHILSDGRAVTITAHYVTPDQVSGGNMIAQMTKDHAALMQWNQRIYVVHGIVYLWDITQNPESGGSASPVLHKFLLWDTRYSDSRREVVFNRETDDPKTIQGLLFLESKTE